MNEPLLSLLKLTLHILTKGPLTGFFPKLSTCGKKMKSTHLLSTKEQLHI